MNKMTDLKISYLFDKLLTNDDFSKNLQKSIEPKGTQK